MIKFPNLRVTAASTLIHVAVGVLAVIVPYASVTIARSWSAEHRHPEPMLFAIHKVPLEAATIDPNWILEGHPSFRVLSFSNSADGSGSNGIWECIGPAKFRWEYFTDESVYILEGGVELEYGGVVHKVEAGSSAHFPAGSRVIWHVPHRVKKAFTLRDPGHVQRVLRKLFGPSSAG